MSFPILRNRDERGFTIVELLIVIVVIGILAAIVITSFSGVQAKARDSKRTTDIATLAKQFEAFYAGANEVSKSGVYPSGTHTDTLAHLTAAIKGLDPGGLSAPGRTSYDLCTPSAIAFTSGKLTTATGCTIDQDHYIYVPLATDGTTLDTTDPAKFLLVYTLENGGYQQKASLN
jgi:prepilin-type N-terminal cleavage/methylation domain-containing protein